MEASELEQPPEFLDRLPAELKCIIARYTTCLDDRQALSLISRAWADAVHPILWKTFTMDLMLSGQRKPLGFAHPL